MGLADSNRCQRRPTTPRTLQLGRLLRTRQAAEYLAMSSWSLRQLVDHGGEGRTVKLTRRVFELLKACCAGKGEDDYVFTRKNSKPVKDFRDAWRTATSLQVCPGLLVHDLRRTGPRKLRGLGVDRDTIMRIGGWKTDSVFRRYKIVGERDLQEAGRRPGPETVTVTSRRTKTGQNSKNHKPLQCNKLSVLPEGVYSLFLADAGSAAGVAGGAGNDRPICRGDSAGSD